MSLAKKAASGFLWTTGATLGSRVVTIVSTFVLTRFLPPEIQGEVNLAYGLVLTAGTMTAIGVVQFLAANPEEGRDMAFHGTVLVLSTGLIACLASILVAPYYGDLLGVEALAQYVPGLALAHFLDRMTWVPRGVLVRDMRFRMVGLRVAVSELVFAASSVTFAYLGWGGFAIVAGNLVRGAVGILFSFSVTSWRDSLQPCKLVAEKFLRIIRFGAPITIASLFHFGASNWDNSLMGFRFGEATVGLYNQAYRIADLPATNVGEQINDVLVPTFARLEDADSRRRGLLRACGLMAMLVFPMALGLGAVAMTMVEVFYPPSYRGVAPFLIVLATLSISRSIGTLAGGFLQVVGRTRGFIYIDLLLVIMVLGLVWLLSAWGPVMSAVGVGIAFTVSVLLTIRALLPDGITIRDVLAAVARPFVACLPMIAAVVGVRLALLDSGMPAVARLLAEIGVGAAVYVGACFVFAPAITRDFLNLGLSVVRRRRAARAPEAAS